MAGEVAGQMGAHLAGEAPESITGGDHAHWGRGVPDVVEEEGDRLESAAVAVFADDELVGDAVEIIFLGTVVGVEGGDDDAIERDFGLLEIVGDLEAGVGDVGAFADDFAGQILGVHDGEEGMAFGLVFGLELGGGFGYGLAAALFVGEGDDDFVGIDAGVEDALDGGCDDVVGFVKSGDDDAVVDFGGFGVVGGLGGDEAEVGFVLADERGFAATALAALLVDGVGVVKLGEPLVPVDVAVFLEVVVGEDEVGAHADNADEDDGGDEEHVVGGPSGDEDGEQDEDDNGAVAEGGGEDFKGAIERAALAERDFWRHL